MKNQKFCALDPLKLTVINDDEILVTGLAIKTRKDTIVGGETVIVNTVSQKQSCEQFSLTFIRTVA